MTVYERFAELLQKKGVRVADVTRATQIKSTVFSEWKKGKAQPKADKLQKIADYFGVSMDYLLTGQTQSEAVRESPKQSDQERELIDIFRYLNNPGELLRYARYLKDGEKANERKALDA